MPPVYGRTGPRFPWLSKTAYNLSKPALGVAGRLYNIHTEQSSFASQKKRSLAYKIARGERVFLVGAGLAGHNSGVSLVRVSKKCGIEILSNDEEERLVGEKHYDGYPAQTIALLKERLREYETTPKDIHAFLCTWNYIEWLASGAGLLAAHFPASLALLSAKSGPNWNIHHALGVRRTPAMLGRQLGLEGSQPVIAMGHHGNHAAFSYGVSPFNADSDPVMITVLDGFGDQGAISLYVGKNGRISQLRNNASLFDSLGAFYAIISSTQGGWTTLSSEGRYMGAAAWGDLNRLTNPYYKRLRQLFHFQSQGRVYINRSMENWHSSGERRPYKKPLRDILGAPLSSDDMWNPDAVLQVEDIQHAPTTQERVDKAAATQLVFEDVLFHIVDYFIRLTGSSKLILTGGTALNCVANERLLEFFDAPWYRRNLRMDQRLQVWVPPTPGDAGVTMGAAFNFAFQAGVKAARRLEHAFLCGRSPKTPEIERALQESGDIGYRLLGNVHSEQIRGLADLLAFLIAHDAVVGVFQGVAESGPRALGHRSILANPCNPNSLQNINNLVKFREAIRPLAPMATLDAAKELFFLSSGAGAKDYDAYNYMVLTVPCRPEAKRKIPAVVHKDGSARIQIVREEVDPFTHAYLKAMGRHVGVEVSVNTSLNVGTPIVQTPSQALDVLRRAKALTALILIGHEGDTFLAWDTSASHPKDAGRRLLGLLETWKHETGLAYTDNGDPAALLDPC